MQDFWNRLKRQAQENPVLVLAAAAALLTATSKLIGVTIDMRNSHAWAKEVQRRALKDAMSK